MQIALQMGVQGECGGKAVRVGANPRKDKAVLTKPPASRNYTEMAKYLKSFPASGPSHTRLRCKFIPTAHTTNAQVKVVQGGPK